MKRLIFTCLSHLAASNLSTPIGVQGFSVSSSLAKQSLLHFTTTIPTTSTSIQAAETSNDSNMAPESTSSVRIVTYNLLSSHLASPTFHTKCTPENLEASNRLTKLLSKLEDEMSDQSLPIFCLQEVSHDWATALHKFFAERKYHLVTALYGRKFNGYMGIATAYPTSLYQTVNVDLVRLSETRRHGWPRPPRVEETEPGILTNVFWNYPKWGVERIFGTMKYFIRGAPSWSRKDDDAWEVSQYRHNQFIAVNLCKHGDDANKFWVGNYHMPCAFRTPAVMTIHADLVASRIQYLAGKNDEPFVLAGDFNIMPDSPQYTLLTTGTMQVDKEVEKEGSVGAKNLPEPKHGMSWNVNMKGMRSAYLVKNGKEPEFTNNAHNGAMDDESFIGTLDYIFLSDEWKVKEVKDLPTRESVEGGVYPDDNEPSDHLLLAATIEL